MIRSPLVQGPAPALIVLAFVSIAIYARLTRASGIEALSEDFVRTGRANGLRPRHILDSTPAAPPSPRC